MGTRNKTTLISMCKDLWKYRDLTMLLVSRDLKLKYRRSVLGYVWSVLNPLLIMIVMTLVFSSMFSRNIDNYPVYLFTGQLLFNAMNNTTRNAMSAITNNASMLKKTYVPQFLFTVTKTISGMVDLLFSLGALLIVMLVTGSPFNWTNLLFPVVIVQHFIFCLGLGMFLAQANVFFRDINYIYNAVTTAWMYLTPIFYPVEKLPEIIGWLVTHLNPMFFYVDQFRSLVYLGEMPNAYSFWGGIIAAILMLMLGIRSFSKSQHRFILHI